ncbi:MAG: hypothetical protein ACOYJD_04395 [Christensenellales bacterium]|jgi:hypothetical protein
MATQSPLSFIDLMLAIIPLLFLIAATAGLAFITANMASKKGYSKGGFWLLGFFLFIPALIVVLCLDDRSMRANTRMK